MKTCCYCETELEAKEDSWISLGITNFDACQACEDKRRIEHQIELKNELNRICEAAKAEMLLDARNRVENASPPLFAYTSINHSGFKLHEWLKIKEWRLSAEKPWIGLIGPTGTCKSRISWLYAIDEIQRLAVIANQNMFDSLACKEEIESYDKPRVILPTFAAVTGYGFAQMAMAVFSDQGQEALEEIERLKTADILLFDDLGKGLKGTNSKGQESYVANETAALIDYRYQHQLRTIWSANSKPEQIAAGMSADMGAPFAGRLNEASRIAVFK